MYYYAYDRSYMPTWRGVGVGVGQHSIHENLESRRVNEMSHTHICMSFKFMHTCIHTRPLWNPQVLQPTHLYIVWHTCTLTCPGDDSHRSTHAGCLNGIQNTRNHTYNTHATPHTNIHTYIIYTYVYRALRMVGPWRMGPTAACSLMRLWMKFGSRIR